MTKKDVIAVAEGDGIGPEIMQATLNILNAANADLEIKKVEVGEKVYLKGIQTGISDETWSTIQSAKAFLKAPITTPQGGGFKSLNVTIRTALGLYANVRPCVAYSPYVKTKHPKMDVVIIRENEEDLYVGVEYRATQQQYQALKMITQPGCEKIIRYAFEYAKANNRKKVTCFTKDNILKFTDGQFHKTFQTIAEDYPEIENEHWIIDIGAAKLADTPENFDVIVMPNLYGDILSDVAAQIAGSVGMAGSANIGEHGAMFEAIHGSAPRRAGQNLANPSGLILAAVQMLAFLKQGGVAAEIHNAWLKTIEDGMHTYDLYKEGVSSKKVGTKEFAEEVIKRLGQKPSALNPAKYADMDTAALCQVKKPSELKKKFEGVDIFIDFTGSTDEFMSKLKGCNCDIFELEAVYNRGVKVWPGTKAETHCVDCWRCRFKAKSVCSFTEGLKFASELDQKGLAIVQIQTLLSFDGQAEYSK